MGDDLDREKLFLGEPLVEAVRTAIASRDRQRNRQN